MIAYETTIHPRPNYVEITNCWSLQSQQWLKPILHSQLWMRNVQEHSHLALYLKNHNKTHKQNTKNKLNTKYAKIPRMLSKKYRVHWKTNQTVTTNKTKYFQRPETLCLSENFKHEWSGYFNFKVIFKVTECISRHRNDNLATSWRRKLFVNHAFYVRRSKTSMLCTLHKMHYVMKFL